MGLNLNGINHYISVANNFFDNIPSEFTWAVWFKLTNTFSSASFQDQYFFQKWNEAGANFNNVRLKLVSNDGKLKFSKFANGALTQISSTQASWTAGVWYCAVATYSETTGMELFVDGVSVDSDGNTNAVGNATASDTDFTLGSNLTDVGNTNFFKGTIGEAAVWDSILIDAEISQLYVSRIKGLPFQIQTSNLVAYWPLDDFADGVTASGANSIKDRSWNGNDGTPQNNPVVKAEEVLSSPASVFPVVLPRLIDLLGFERAAFRGVNRGIMRGIG